MIVMIGCDLVHLIVQASNHILEMEKQYPDICVAQQLALPRDSQRERTGVYDNIFRRMLNFKNARGKYLWSYLICKKKIEHAPKKGWSGSGIVSLSSSILVAKISLSVKQYLLFSLISNFALLGLFVQDFLQWGAQTFWRGDFIFFLKKNDFEQKLNSEKLKIKFHKINRN